ncbi:MAG: flagellar basal body rod protein FlgB [Anaerolineales bacterium]|nr:flagellar basal body rod protein FlgB [Anaerolineales bacterium]
MPSLLSDSALQAASLALDGLSLRQQIIGHNLANVDTPGYKAEQVNFESTLRRALDEEAPQDLTLTKTDPAHLPFRDDSTDFTRITLRKGGSTRADGNNVDIDVELVQMTETNMRYQALTQLASKKLLLMREIAART